MKKYIEIYEYYKNLILTNQIEFGAKLPSIRSATQIFDVSKTTIINAYFELQADGYIISNEKSGYYVSYEAKNDAIINSKKDNNKSKLIYDFKSGDADIESFDIKLWQRYIKSSLRQQERLLSYGDEQGEEDLRIALAEYIREKRNVVTSPDRIVVGAGVQSLLSILCTLLDKGSVSFPDNSFYKGICLFKDYGFNVFTRYKDANIIYVCPSHMTSYGDVMPLKRRMELVEYSAKQKSIVIEDDYDNDFMYQSKPTPSLFALSKANNVVYMGSFSNVLIPGIRISFMVLTEDLANKFAKEKERFSQTASKTEQIALCQYIRDGHINSQTRKVRRLYTAKAKILFDEIKKQIAPKELSISENSLQVKMIAPFNKDIKIFEQNGIAVDIIEVKNGMIKLVLSPSAIMEKDIENAVKKLKEILI